MKAFLAVTDRDWYRFLHARPDLDEVNFWQPGGSRRFTALAPGQPFLFKLHAPDNFVVGGAFFAHFSLLPVSLAWEAFGEKNGVPSLLEMRRRVEKYRRSVPDPHADYTIGCIILRDPFFWNQADWLPTPPDFSREIVQGKTYDLRTEPGRSFWEEVTAHLRRETGRGAQVVREQVYGEDRLVRTRLGQGTFRVLVTDLYQRRCAVTREKALPVLEAAHIRPVSTGGTHRVDNGLLLRSDVHTLFDRGYVGVDANHQLLVSRRLKSDFDNGEHYYRLKGARLLLPKHDEDRPAGEFLEWHRDTVFLG